VFVILLPSTRNIQTRKLASLNALKRRQSF
jgi:hypothetical protein